MQGYLYIDEPAFGSFQWQHRRLALCMAISAVALFLAMANFDLSRQFEFLRWVPPVLEISLRQEPEDEVSEPPEVLPMPEPVTPAAATERSEPAMMEAATAPSETAGPTAQSETAGPTAQSETTAREPAVSQSPGAETHIDW